MMRAKFPPCAELAFTASVAEFLPLSGPNFSTGVGLEDGRLQELLWRGFGHCYGEDFGAEPGQELRRC